MRDVEQIGKNSNREYNDMYYIDAIFDVVNESLVRHTQATSTMEIGALSCQPPPPKRHQELGLNLSALTVLRGKQDDL